MGLRIVNAVPASAGDYISPDQPFHLGLKSTDAKVVPGSINAVAGLSSFTHQQILPEADGTLQRRGLSVALETSEHRRPLGIEATRSISAGALKLTKGTDSNNDVGVYELKVPISQGASVLGYFKFRKKSWASFSADWCSLPNMTGVYLGLEHGTFNNACFLFLRAADQGSLVVGGPLQAYNSVRPAQAELPFAWGAVADDTTLELWVHYNVVGYPSPFIPAETPIVEVWGRIGDGSPTLLTRNNVLPVGQFGAFRSEESQFDNYRSGPTGYATLYIGNVGRTGDELVMDDWAIFPDFRTVVLEGVALPHVELSLLPDSPVKYSAADGSPTALKVGPWRPAADAGYFAPDPAPYFQPGRKRTPFFFSLKKDFFGGAALSKDEPWLGRRDEGAVVEALISGTSLGSLNDAFGGGFALEDGSQLYKVVMLDSSSRRTFGILKDEDLAGSFSDGYHTPSGDYDWRSLLLVRLVLDRLRDEVRLEVNDESALSLGLDAGFPASTASRVLFGHVLSSAARGSVNVGFLNYLLRYKAWESSDGDLPNVASLAFTSVGAGGTNLFTSDGMLRLNKSAGDGAFGFRRVEDFDESCGVQIDFKAGVEAYASAQGASSPRPAEVGSGIQLSLGSRLLTLGFFECGEYGRRVGIIPGSGSVQDILTQTQLGRAFSAPCDWLAGETFFRLTYRAYKSVELQIGGANVPAAISIPWNGSAFDLPSNTEQPVLPYLFFGHYGLTTSSVTRWGFLRYGSSAGYEMAVRPEYPVTRPAYLFGGKALIRTEFADGAME